jgi:hypothetical protein
MELVESPVTNEMLRAIFPKNQGVKQNASPGNLGGRKRNANRWNTRRQEVEESTESVNFAMRGQNTSRGNLGREKVKNTVQKRICGSLSMIPWFINLTFIVNGNSPNYAERIPLSQSAIGQYPVHATTLCRGDSGSTQKADCLHNNHYLPEIHSRTSTSSTITPKDSNPNTTSINFLLNSDVPISVPSKRTKYSPIQTVGNEENPAKLSHELVPHDTGSSSSDVEGIPATRPLSDGQGSVRAPQILESTHAFLTIESEPRPKPLTPLKQNFPTSYGGSNSEIYSKAQRSWQAILPLSKEVQITYRS